MTQAVGTPAMRTGLTEDLYLRLRSIDSENIVLEAQVFQYMYLLWTGGLVAAAGGLWARRRPASWIRPLGGEHEPERWPRWADRLAWLAAAAATVVIAVNLLTASPTPADRVEPVAYRLRCPVCQSLSVAESPSETAQAMWDIITQQVAEGRSDEEIIAFFVDRYGEWIILAPPAQGSTPPLWLLPLAALGLGLMLAVGRRRRLELPRGERVKSP